MLTVAKVVAVTVPNLSARFLKVSTSAPFLVYNWPKASLFIVQSNLNCVNKFNNMVKDLLNSYFYQ